MMFAEIRCAAYEKVFEDTDIDPGEKAYEMIWTLRLGQIKTYQLVHSLEELCCVQRNA